jgi:hypothetical protein
MASQLGLLEILRIVNQAKTVLGMLPHPAEKTVYFTLLREFTLYFSRELARKSVAELKNWVIDDNEISVATPKDPGLGVRKFMVDRLNKNLCVYEQRQLFHALPATFQKTSIQRKKPRALLCANLRQDRMSTT